VNVVPQIDAMTKVADDLWYKDAIIYQLHVKAFADSNHDGVGDFEGLTEKLDYLQDLGVNTLWLLPFYPSPGKDDGYDISDYRRINPEFGTLRDFRRFMNEAHKRGLRVITELVINHTSDQHPWFRRARRARRGTDAHNWYVWSDTDQKYAGTRIIFRDTEKSNWSWDADANAYYWHRFFAHQPDLNFDNPKVIWAIVQVMRRWLDMGVDGFRLDAIPYLCEREGTNNENLPETHEVIKKIRQELDAYAPGKLLLAEANQWPEDVNAYFGSGDECHMAYHFPLMPRIYMAIAQEDRFPIADILRQTPDIPDNCQWALFLRNHDELTLEMVTDVERDYLWTTYATDPRARINLGIRRRLAPLMDNDRRKIELMNSLLFSLPGTPIIYYGDEIGMGDNIYLGDRNGVRTPMQWTSDRNGGFSRCDPARLYAPMIMDTVYGFNSVNVESQSRNLSSLLSWTKRLIGVRKSSKVFGRGSLSFIRPSNRAVLVYLRQYENETILCVANMSRSAQAAELDLSPWKGQVPLEMLGRTRFPRIGDAPYVVTLAPYGFFWFYLCDEPEPNLDVRHAAREFVTLVVGDGWDSLLGGRSQRALERDVLPAFMQERRWYGDKSRWLPSVHIQSAIPLQHGASNALLTLINVSGSQSAEARYLLPFTIKWARFDTLGPAQSSAAAAVRRGPREGSLVDAGSDRDFIELLLKSIHSEQTISAGDQRIEFHSTAAFKEMPEPLIEKLHAIDREQSNTTSIADSNYVIKLLRRVNTGIHPEIEIGRFLVEAGFKNAPDLLGWAELIEGEQRSAIAVVHRFVENQGDAWAVTGAFLDRFIDEQRVLAGEPAGESAELTSYIQRIRSIGLRTAELQRVLASRSDIPDFAPEAIEPADVAMWTDRLTDRCGQAFDMLRNRRDDLSDPARITVDLMLAQSESVAAYIQQLLPSQVDASKIRHHGDFHLGQVLIAKDDAYILDFEGEPRRSLEERRQKVPAARDVAGLIRSIDYSTTSALLRAHNLTPEEREGLTPKLATWREGATEAFWQACRQYSGEGLWPADDAAAVRLLEFFLLEKAFYEIEYELTNRPSWVHVPVDGTWRILLRNGVVQP
jgi:maltose alpha-D-glucosyltransferase/alpha-amylase